MLTFCDPVWLQSTLDEKSRKLFDYSDTLENKVASSPSSPPRPWCGPLNTGGHCILELAYSPLASSPVTAAVTLLGVSSARDRCASPRDSCWVVGSRHILSRAKHRG